FLLESFRAGNLERHVRTFFIYFAADAFVEFFFVCGESVLLQKYFYCLAVVYDHIAINVAFFDHLLKVKCICLCSIGRKRAEQLEADQYCKNYRVDPVNAEFGSLLRSLVWILVLVGAISKSGQIILIVLVIWFL